MLEKVKKPKVPEKVCLCTGQKERREEKGNVTLFRESAVMVKTQKGRVTQTESQLENCQICFIAFKKIIASLNHCIWFILC